MENTDNNIIKIIEENEVIEKEITKISEAEKFNENPYLKNIDSLIKKKGKKYIVGAASQVILNEDTGETKPLMLLGARNEVDKEEFAKIFVDEIKALFGLSNKGIKILSYVLNCLRKDDDEVYLHIPDVMKFCNYKQPNQIYKGLAELVKNNILALSTRFGWWFINPRIIFNGNRIAFIKEYTITEKKQLPLQQNLEFEETKLIEKK
jgi:hypothetical protein